MVEKLSGCYPLEAGIENGLDCQWNCADSDISRKSEAGRTFLELRGEWDVVTIMDSRVRVKVILP